MRLTRGLFQSLGASGSLLAAGACVLFVVSAAIGFRGWPALGGAEANRGLVLATPPLSPVQRAGSPSGAPGAPRRLAAAEPVPAGPAARVLTRGGGAAPSLGLGAPPRPRPVAPNPATPSATAAPSTATATAPLRPVTRRAGDTVRTSGHAVGQAVAPASPPVANTVTTATDTVAGVVDKTGSLLAP